MNMKRIWSNKPSREELSQEQQLEDSVGIALTDDELEQIIGGSGGRGTQFPTTIGVEGEGGSHNPDESGPGEPGVSPDYDPWTHRLA